MAEEEDIVRGRIKWYDTTKGFGFIIGDGCDQDILLHANVLRDYGRNSISGNALVEVKFLQTDRGCQATKIISIEVPAPDLGGDATQEFNSDLTLQNKSAKLHPARVKWFDRGKGFGFVNIFGDASDIFIHMEVVNACGLSELQSGEAVGIRTADGSRGRMAWDIRVWDHAIEEGV